MMRQIALFRVAVQFLTRLPVPGLRDFEPEWTARSARYFPLVGALVGLASAAVFVVASEVWSGALPVLLAIAAGVLITGAFHEDGLADTFDGLGGGQTRERRLEIMKDSRIGAFGALGLGLTLAIKIAALGELSAWTGAFALVAAHAGGRAAAVIAMRVLPYAGDRDRAKVKPVADGVTSKEVFIAVLFAILALIPLLVVTPLTACVALAAGGAVATLTAQAAAKLIGGWVGDTLGATEQMFEVGFLLACAGVLAVA